MQPSWTLLLKGAQHISKIKKWKRVRSFSFFFQPFQCYIHKKKIGNELFVQWWCVPSQRVTETFLFPRKRDALAGELNYSESTHLLHKTNPCFFKSFSRILENAKILKDLAHSPSWFDGPTFWRCFCSQKENNYSSSRLDSFNNT